MARHESFDPDAIFVYWTARSLHKLYAGTDEVKASSLSFTDEKGAIKLIKKLRELEATDGLYRGKNVSHVTCSNISTLLKAGSDNS